MTKLAIPDQSRTAAAVTREPIPEGLHDAVIISVQQVSGEKAPSGNPYLRIEYAITDVPPVAGQLVTAYGNVSFAPDAMWALSQFLDAVGSSLEEVDEFDDDVLPGTRVRIITSLREWPLHSGQMTTDVGRVYPADYVPAAGEPGSPKNEVRSGILEKLAADLVKQNLDPEGGASPFAPAVDIELGPEIDNDRPF